MYCLLLLERRNNEEVIACLQALLHPEAHEEGGFGFTNKELLAKQRGVVTDIIKEVQ